MRRGSLQILWVALFGLAIGVLGRARYPLPDPSTGTHRIQAVQITPEQRSQALWLDARADAEFQAGRVEGALPLRMNDWDDLLPAVVEAWTPGRMIIVYCGTGSCSLSEDVANRLHSDTGWQNIFVLEGDWRAVATRKSP